MQQNSSNSDGDFAPTSISNLKKRAPDASNSSKSSKRTKTIFKKPLSSKGTSKSPQERTRDATMTLRNYFINNCSSPCANPCEEDKKEKMPSTRKRQDLFELDDKTKEYNGDMNEKEAVEKARIESLIELGPKIIVEKDEILKETRLKLVEEIEASDSEQKITEEGVVSAPSGNSENGLSLRRTMSIEVNLEDYRQKKIICPDNKDIDAFLFDVYFDDVDEDEGISDMTDDTPDGEKMIKEAREHKNEVLSCPVCFFQLADLSEQQVSVHVNKCLDESFSKKSPEGAIQHSVSSSTSSWSLIFNDIQSKVSGMWSASNATGIQVSDSTNFWGDKAKFKSNSSTVTSISSREGRRICPFYKRLPETSFTVDAFCFGAIPDCTGYFLSHFHSDHYGGLTSSWRHGPIYCSNITGNLVIQQLQVDPSFVVRLPLDKETLLPEGCTVTLIDANHCPGSVVFLFKVPLSNGKVAMRYLHTGDFRANPRLVIHPSIKQPQNPPIDVLYLDTTYLNPKYVFPAQEEIVMACCELVKKVRQKQYSKEMVNEISGLSNWIKRVEKGKTDGIITAELSANTEMKKEKKTEDSALLIVVGTYLIGKEKVFVNIAKTLQSKIFVQEKKRHILSCLENSEIMDMLSDNPRESAVHVVGLGQITPEFLSSYLHAFRDTFTSIMAFRPTGWTFRASSSSISTASLATITAPAVPFKYTSLKPSYISPTVTIYGVPYSEHSSFRELAAFIASLDIRRIIPTVNVGSEKSRAAMEVWFRKWQKEKRRNGNIEIVPFKSNEHW